MMRKSTLYAVLAATMLSGPMAIAQGDAPYANRIGRSGQDQRGSDRDRREDARREDARREDWRRDDGRQQNRYNDNNDNNRRGYDQRADNRDFRHERGAGPNHSYYRGGRLPPQYRTRQYVVEDWRGHHLSAPPRGYQWVQSGSDYILVAIATGVILNLLLNN